MSLREILERIWNDPVVRCTKHVTWWSDEPSKPSDSGGILSFEPEDDGLFWRRGKRAELTKPGRRP